MGWLALLLHAALVVLVSPSLSGLLRGDPGQGWRDLVRLARKPAVQSQGASFVFSGAPALAAGAAATAALLVPGFALGLGTAPAADLIVVAGLLAVSRAVPALAAHEAGAAQVHAGGRIAAARLPVEPVLLLVALAVLLMSGGTNLEAAALRDAPPGMRLPGVLAGLAMLAVVAAEPAAPSLFSGRALALVTFAGQVRLVAGLSLVAAIGLPFGMAPPGAGAEAWGVGVACWLLKLAVLGSLVRLAGRHRKALPAAALLALIAAVVLGVQGRV